MNYRITAMLASAAALAIGAGQAFAQEQTTAAPAAAPAAAAAPPALAPSLTAPLTANPSPMAVDLGPLGNKVYITGVVSGLAFAQSNHVSGDVKGSADLSNAQIFINKADGQFQYFIDVGAYSFPALGTLPYTRATATPGATYDFLPMAYVKWAPTANFSIQAGKLATLIGAEYAFTFQNSNIERGLLWGVQPITSQGVQVNYTTGPVTFNVAVTDGYYSHELTTVSGAATWVASPTDTLIVQAQGNTRKSDRTSGTTLPVYNNSTLVDAMWTHTMGAWSFTPNFQYTTTPAYPIAGYIKDTSTWGAGLLTNYTFDAKGPLAGVSLPARFEYIEQSDGAGSASPLFGPGSAAYSLTLTPTYTFGRYFVRGEVSYVDITKGSGYGEFGDKKDQVRGLLELGVMF